jgi:hypothetical protein
MRRHLVAAAAGLLALAPAASAATDSAVIRLSTPSPFPSGCDHAPPAGTLYPNAEVQPDIATDPLDPLHIVTAWQTDRWSGVGGRGLVTATTYDGGRTWTWATPAVSTCAGGSFDRATDTQVSIGPDGSAYLVSLSMNTSKPQGDHALLVTRSRDGGRSWGLPFTIIREGAGDTANVWNDLPTVYASGSDVYVAWDRVDLTDDTATVYLAHSADRGVTWSAPTEIYDPGNGAAVSLRLAATPAGGLVAFFGLSRPGSSDWVVIRSADRGTTWSAPTTVAPMRSVGTRESGGRNVRDGHDAIGQIAVGPHGELRAVWQGSQFAGDHDGIVTATSADGGVSWSAPAPVGSAPAQQFMPAVAINSDGVAGVTYYQLDATGTTYWQATAGSSWLAQKLAGPFDVTAAPVVADGSYYVGDFHGMAAAGPRFVSVFARANAGQPDNRTDVFLTLG